MKQSRMFREPTVTERKPRTQSNDLERKEEINIHSEEKEETRIQKNEERLRNLWDNLKHSNIQINTLASLQII